MTVSVLPYRWSAVLSTFLLLAGCGRTEPNRGRSPAATTGGLASEWFVDGAERSGLQFVHVNGMTGRFYEPEIAAPGVALFDYDNDGDLDVFLVQGHVLEAGESSLSLATVPTGSTALEGRLYRNDLAVNEDGTRTLTFVDVTAASGIHARGYGMGLATGDFNNDGCLDIFLTNFGANQLLRNNCDGTFTDVSTVAGIEHPSKDRFGSWSVSASFADFDRDGWLDLFVGNYLAYSLDRDKACVSWSGEPDYCAPASYRPARSRMYHNNRNGTFTDVTDRALVGGEAGPALGSVTADFNGDRWIDLFVANDGQANSLWMNQHDGTFKNTAFLAGVALNADGKTTASMGVDAGDFDGDGDEDLFVTNLAGEGASLFVNDGFGNFEDRTKRLGLFSATLPYTGFGAGWIDVDNDGLLDILTVNGAVRVLEALAQAKDPFPFHQKKQLFRNLGNGQFTDVTAQAGGALQLSEVGRGAAFGDIDNDGDMDVLIGNDNGRVRLLINGVGNKSHWVGLRLVGGRSPRDMLGARVAVVQEGVAPRWRRVRTDGSYASANDPRVLVGLGASAKPSTVQVIWPSGRFEEWAHIPADAYSTLKEGSGK